MTNIYVHLFRVTVKRVLVFWGEIRGQHSVNDKVMYLKYVSASDECTRDISPMELLFSCVLPGTKGACQLLVLL